MAKNNNFSLTVMVMIFAIIAIFVGYFIGNKMIEMALGSPEQKTEITKNKKNEDTNTQSVEIGETENTTNNEQTNKINTESFSSDGYAVQAGAFNSFENALSLKKELVNKGFEVIITQGKPHKVRLGPFPEKEEAEKTKEEIEKMGYNGFVTNLEN